MLLDTTAKKTIYWKTYQKTHVEEINGSKLLEKLKFRDLLSDERKKTAAGGHWKRRSQDCALCAHCKTMAIRASGRFHQGLHNAVALYLPESSTVSFWTNLNLGTFFPMSARNSGWRPLSTQTASCALCTNTSIAITTTVTMTKSRRCTQFWIAPPGELPWLSTKHLDGIIGHIPDTLTPFGLLDINSVEVS